MFLDSQEKEIIKKVTSKKSFELEELIEITLKQIKVFDERAFEVWRGQGRNNFLMGVTHSNEIGEEEKHKIDSIASYISKSIKLIDNLEKDGYLHITKTGIPVGKPLLSVGNKKDKEEEREVTADRVERFKRDRNILFSFETSAKTGENIENLFIFASKILYHNNKDRIA